MIRRNFLKMLLASPLAGFIKPNVIKPDEIEFETMGTVPWREPTEFISETTGTSGGVWATYWDENGESRSITNLDVLEAMS